MTTNNPRIKGARDGTDPALICKVPSGWVFLCNLQHISGYCILQSDPVVESINSLNNQERTCFFNDMSMVGDALMEALGSYRINYFIAGNSEPVLHAHIIPRFMDEPENLRKNHPWAYPNVYSESNRFDAQRDTPLIQKIKPFILKRL